MAGVVLENVSRLFPGGKAAVRELNLEVRDREFLVLVGPSGCGKSTTLRLIAGLEKPSSGTIRIGSRVVSDVPPQARDVAMVFQNYALYPHLTVARNLAFGLELRERTGGWAWLWRWALPARQRAGWAERQAAVDLRVRQTAATLGIADLLDRLPGKLSGGEKQRVALGRAIVRQASVYLFDEPLSNLDAKLRIEMRRELKQLHQRFEATMVLVTHDQVEALTLGQRVAVMHAGQIQQVGTPREVYDRPANRFVAGFIGTPGMNFIEGELTTADGANVFRRGDWSIPLDGRPLARQASRGPVVLGVRAEDLRIEPRRSGAGQATVPVVVRSVELLGDSATATVEMDAATCGGGASLAEHKKAACCVVIKIEPRGNVQPGDCVSVGVDPTRVHLFDPDSGKNWSSATTGH
jgi:multiple sugar transport system ATP-binding protein